MVDYLVLKTGLPLIKNVIKPLAKSVLISLGLTAATLAADAVIDKKMLGSGSTTLIISNEEMNDIIKFVEALEDSNILLKGVTKTIENETKEQKGRFLSVYLGTFETRLLGNLLSGRGIVRASSVRPSSSASQNKKGKEIVRAGSGNKIEKQWDLYGIIKRSRGEKKRGIRAIDEFRKKLMIPDSEISKCPEFAVKSKMGKNL